MEDWLYIIICMPQIFQKVAKSVWRVYKRVFWFCQWRKALIWVHWSRSFYMKLSSKMVESSKQSIFPPLKVIFVIKSLKLYFPLVPKTSKISFLRTYLPSFIWNWVLTRFFGWNRVVDALTWQCSVSRLLGNICFL